MNRTGAPIRRTARERERSSWQRLALVGLLAGLFSSMAVAQQSSDEIAWNRALRLPDGRLLVTDGAITLDAALAKPGQLPSAELPAATGELMARYMAADLPDEFELGDLERGIQPNTYRAPSGVTFAAKYVNLLRRAVPGASLRMKSDLEPAVILSEGRAVGLVMALRGPSR